MVQVAFSHNDGAAASRFDCGGILAPVLSIFSDRTGWRDELESDAQAAGLALGRGGTLGALLDEEARALGDVIVVDCPDVDAAGCAALMRLDMRAAQSGASLVVATSIDALDDVFACLDQSKPQILVAPTRSEQLVALGRALAGCGTAAVRELSDQDRITLVRLTEQVSEIAARIDRLAGASVEPTRLASPAISFAVANEDDGDRLVTKAARTELPDPRVLRKVIRQRQQRAKYFDAALFADPAWDMLLDLTAARAEKVRVSVTSLCIAAAVPPTTALRWIAQMTEDGVFVRVSDPHDKRRAFIDLSETAADAMARYFAELGHSAARLV